MSAHTPGPWFIGGAVAGIREDHVAVFGGDMGRGSDFACAVLGGCREQDEANARLVSAAPDLLAACELVLAYFGEDWMGGVTERAALRAAIAKAVAK